MAVSIEQFRVYATQLPRVAAAGGDALEDFVAVGRRAEERAMSDRQAEFCWDVCRRRIGSRCKQREKCEAEDKPETAEDKAVANYDGVHDPIPFPIHRPRRCRTYCSALSRAGSIRFCVLPRLYRSAFRNFSKIEVFEERVRFQ